MTFAPIHYTSAQVARIVEFAAFFSDNFAQQAGEVASRIPLIAAGIVAPTPAVLRFFGLQVDGDGYIWFP